MHASLSRLEAGRPVAISPGEEGPAMNHWIPAAVPAAIALAIMTYGFYLAG